MKAAVVGAGFAGLAISFFLLERGICVDLFDARGVGCGASGVSAGLLHPYVGEQVRRSVFADTALQEAKKLLQFAQKYSARPVAQYEGILRRADSEQSQTFMQHIQTYQDVEWVQEGVFLIRSGIVVDSAVYLSGLFAGLQSKGLNFIQQKVDAVEDLSSYDIFFLSLGAGHLLFAGDNPLSLQAIKGQSITSVWPHNIAKLQKSWMGKGYVIPLDGGYAQVGSTYERGKVDSCIDPETAVRLLTPKVEELFPQWRPLEVVQCKAGVRVARKDHYFPLLKQVHSKGWVLTGFGSRGLLYHAYAAKKLVEMAL